MRASPAPHSSVLARISSAGFDVYKRRPVITSHAEVLRREKQIGFKMSPLLLDDPPESVQGARDNDSVDWKTTSDENDDILVIGIDFGTTYVFHH